MTLSDTDARSALAPAGFFSGPLREPATSLRASTAIGGAKICALPSPRREARKGLAAKFFSWMMSIRLGQRFQNAPGAGSIPSFQGGGPNHGAHARIGI